MHPQHTTPWKHALLLQASPGRDRTIDMRSCAGAPHLAQSRAQARGVMMNLASSAAWLLMELSR